MLDLLSAAAGEGFSVILVILVQIRNLLLNDLRAVVDEVVELFDRCIFLGGSPVPGVRDGVQVRLVGIRRLNILLALHTREIAHIIHGVQNTAGFLVWLQRKILLRRILLSLII